VRERGFDAPVDADTEKIASKSDRYRSLIAAHAVHFVSEQEHRRKLAARALEPVRPRRDPLGQVVARALVEVDKERCDGHEFTGVIEDLMADLSS
jgi:hypothetical protein